jgi:hypothetical protein
VTARHAALERRLERAEVADVVARPEPHAELIAPLFQCPEQRKERQEIVRLKKDLRFVGGPPHRHRELNLPAMGTGRGSRFEDLRQLGQAEAVDLRVARDE